MSIPEILEAIRQAFESATRILITGQGNPDGDSLGSQLALYELLFQQHQVSGTETPLEMVIVNDELPPPGYAFFPNQQWICAMETVAPGPFDLGFVLDSSRERVGQVLPLLQQCRTTINIDHHRSRAALVETINWVEPEQSSVAEMIYAFFEHPAWQIHLTPTIATCLYAGLIYDTGVFRYPSTTPRTHRIAAELMSTGIDAARLVEQMVLEKPFSALRLLTGVLQTLQCDATGALVWGHITQALWHAVQAQPGDDDALISQYAFSREGKVAILFKEISTQEIKVSFRTRGALDVGQFARTLHPQGGGHPRAAGCTLSGTLPEVENRVITALQRALQLF